MSLCILFPVFLISPSAAVVDGNTVNTAWWYDNAADYIIFGDQILSRTGYDNITVQVDIELQDDVDPKQLFSFDIDFNIGSYGTVTVTKFQLLNKKSVVVDNLSVDFSDNKISVSDLQYNDHIKYIRIQLLISRPIWIVEADESYFSIDGTQYTFQKGTTWEDWVNSDYNTLNLYIDNGKIYGDDVILKYNGESVDTSDFIIEQVSYTLEPLGSVSTTINFYVYCYGGDDRGQTKTYQALMGMTWVEWVASDYNVDGFSTYHVSNTIKDASGRFIYSSKLPGYDAADPNSFVHTQDVIIQDHTYYAFFVSSSSYSLRGYNNYTFNFSVTSISSTILDELGIWESILYFLKDIPNKVSDAIGIKLEELFIPNVGRIEAIKAEFENELKDHFGILYDSVDLVDMVADTFVYRNTDSTITLPSVTIDLSGTPFTFGGYEVDVIPDGFEGLVDALRLVVNISCTWWFVLAMKKRLEEVLSK